MTGHECCVTVAPCAIKGATFDYFTGCQLEGKRHREERKERDESYDRSPEGVSPARVRRPSAPNKGIDLLRAYVSLYLTTVELYAPSPALIWL